MRPDKVGTHYNFIITTLKIVHRCILIVMNKKKIITIISILLVIIILSAGILIALDKITGSNTIDTIKNFIAQSSVTQETTQEIDTTPLEINYETTEAIIYEQSTAITVKSNKEIIPEDENKYHLILTKVGEDQGKKYYLYALEIKNIGVGEANLKPKLKDAAGNVSELNLKITRQDYVLPFGLKEISKWENSSYTADGDSLTAKVNKEYKLIDDYAPTDLKNLNQDYLLYTNTGSIMLRKEAADYLKVMLTDLQKETGKNVVIASGYRSYSEQFKLYVNWVRQLGQEEADKVSARPGFSEHQLGTVIDFIDQETGLVLTNDFETSVAGAWIKANGYKYGYVQSYPESKENLTGYSHEAWHYRYIGIDNAKKVQESGLTLKEWLDQNS